MCLNFSWPKATPGIVGRFAGRMWKNTYSNKWRT